MNIFRYKFVWTLLALCLPLLIASPSSAGLLPDNLVMEDEFQPGYGAPVGKIRLYQGEVVVMHADQLRGYRAMIDLPLYQGDTIVTLETGKVQFGLKDGSTMTLSSDTKLTITLSVYNPKKKIRSSFLDMVFGKVLFAVRKLTDFKNSQVKSKTHTAVVGVRGSQWVQVVTNEYTEVTALIKTKLGVISTAFPEVEPLILEDFDQTTVYIGQLPSKVIKVSNKQLKKFEEDFTITLGDDVEYYKKKDTDAEGYEGVGPEIVLPESALIKNFERPHFFDDIDRDPTDLDDLNGGGGGGGGRVPLADLPPPPERLP